MSACLLACLQAESMLSPEKLDEFKITVDEKDFESALKPGKIPSSGFVSVKSSSEKRKRAHADDNKASKAQRKPKGGKKKPKR